MSTCSSTVRLRNSSQQVIETIVPRKSEGPDGAASGTRAECLLRIRGHLTASAPGHRAGAARGLTPHLEYQRPPRLLAIPTFRTMPASTASVSNASANFCGDWVHGRTKKIDWGASLQPLLAAPLPSTNWENGVFVFRGKEGKGVGGGVGGVGGEGEGEAGGGRGGGGERDQEESDSEHGRGEGDEGEEPDAYEADDTTSEVISAGLRVCYFNSDADYHSPRPWRPIRLQKFLRRFNPPSTITSAKDALKIALLESCLGTPIQNQPNAHTRSIQAPSNISFASGQSLKFDPFGDDQESDSEDHAAPPPNHPQPPVEPPLQLHPGFYHVLGVFYHAPVASRALKLQAFLDEFDRPASDINQACREKVDQTEDGDDAISTYGSCLGFLDELDSGDSTPCQFDELEESTSDTFSFCSCQEALDESESLTDYGSCVDTDEQQAYDDYVYDGIVNSCYATPNTSEEEDEADSFSDCTDGSSYCDDWSSVDDLEFQDAPESPALHAVSSSVSICGHGTVRLCLVVHASHTNDIEGNSERRSWSSTRCALGRTTPGIGVYPGCSKPTRCNGFFVNALAVSLCQRHQLIWRAFPGTRTLLLVHFPRHCWRLDRISARHLHGTALAVLIE